MLTTSLPHFPEGRVDAAKAFLIQLVPVGSSDRDGPTRASCPGPLSTGGVCGPSRPAPSLTKGREGARSPHALGQEEDSFWHRPGH